MAGRNKDTGGQLQGSIPLGGNCEICFFIGQSDFNLSLEGPDRAVLAASSLPAERYGSFLSGEGWIRDKGNVADVRATGGCVIIIGHGTAHSCAGILRRFIAQVESTLAGRNRQADDGGQLQPVGHVLALCGDQLLQLGKMQGIGETAPLGPLDRAQVGGNVDRKLRLVYTVACGDLQDHGGITGLAALDDDGHPLGGGNIDIGLVVKNTASDAGVRRVGFAEELVVNVLDKTLYFIFHHRHTGGYHLNAVDGDGDLLCSKVPRLDGDLGCAGGFAVNVACAAVIRLGDGNDVGVAALPGDVDVLIGGVGRLDGGGDALALGAGGAGLQTQIVGRLEPVVAAELQFCGLLLSAAVAAIIAALRKEGRGGQGESQQQGQQQGQNPAPGGMFHSTRSFSGI